MEYTAEQYLDRIENKRLNSTPLYSREEMIDFAEKYAKQLTLTDVSFELPSDDIFDKPEVSLNNPLEEFYYYERPTYLEDDQKQFKERLQKALNYLKGN